MILRMKSNYFNKQFQPIGLCDGDNEFSLRQYLSCYTILINFTLRKLKACYLFLYANGHAPCVALPSLSSHTKDFLHLVCAPNIVMIIKRLEVL
jgi:hypothetical protein